ncbi:MAG: putative decarboxylase [Burkholderiales bacterium]|nr:putative decarboxylase [Burkholderiales bacterium]
MTTPRFIVGTVYPTEKVRNPPQAQPLLPPDIQQISASIEIQDYTEAGVNEGMQRYWRCVGALAHQGANSITLAGLPVASQLGRPRVLELIKETAEKTHAIADAHGEAVVAALHHLGADRIAIASRWSEKLNGALIAYLNDAGIEVLAVTSAGQWAKQSFSMSIEEGVRLAFQLGREAMRRAPQAKALLLPGGAWRSLAVVPILEEDYGIPVITNRIAQTWRLIAAGIAPPVEGWGRLLAAR